MERWNGKLKAVTFSFDDGVCQDERAIAILNKYGLKATFNLNSARLGTKHPDVVLGNPVCRDCVDPDKVKEVYKGHEVAVHTLTHPNLTLLSDSEVIHQVEDDRKELSKLVGYEVQGMAYPCGGVNNDERVHEIILKNTGVKFARTITSSHSFDLQEKLIQFNPTVYWCEKETMFDLVKKFVELKTDKPQLLYIWGHCYELDSDTWNISWEEFEEVCKLLSGHDDIYCGTNSEVLL